MTLNALLASAERVQRERLVRASQSSSDLAIAHGTGGNSGES